MTDLLKELNEMFDEALENAEARYLGEILIQARGTLNLKLVDIARITGLSESLIGKLESDQVTDMKVSTVKKLSIAYDVPVNVFMSFLGRDEDLADMGDKAAKTATARTLLKSNNKTTKVDITDFDRNLKKFEELFSYFPEDFIITKGPSIKVNDTEYTITHNSGKRVEVTSELKKFFRSRSLELGLNVLWPHNNLFIVRE